jgi:hypothetical protein
MMIGLVTLAAALTGCSDSLFPERSCADIPSMESLAYVTLPPSAADIRAECDGFTDFYIYLTFTMSPDDLAAFQTAILTPLSDADIPPVLLNNTQMREWGLNPDAITTFAAGEYDEFPFQFVLIDMSDPARYVVWVYTYTT